MQAPCRERHEISLIRGGFTVTNTQTMLVWRHSMHVDACVRIVLVAQWQRTCTCACSMHGDRRRSAIVGRSVRCDAPLSSSCSRIGTARVQTRDDRSTSDFSRVVTLRSALHHVHIHALRPIIGLHCRISSMHFGGCIAALLCVGQRTP